MHDVRRRRGLVRYLSNIARWNQLGISLHQLPSNSLYGRT